MKNLISWVKAGFFALIPFLMAAVVSYPGHLRIDFPPITAPAVLQHLDVLVTGILGIYEVAARFVPTVHNYSLVNALARLLDEFIRNRAAPGGPNGSFKMEHTAGHGLRLYSLDPSAHGAL